MREKEFDNVVMPDSDIKNCYLIKNTFQLPFKMLFLTHRKKKSLSIVSYLRAFVKLFIVIHIREAGVGLYRL